VVLDCSNWYNGDSVKCTVVQSEFQIQVKAFIPYAWTEGEDTPSVNAAMGDNVAEGDFRAFQNVYSDRSINYDVASFRLMQKVTLTPYEDLHSSVDLTTERLAQPAILSEHYDKATSVHPSEQNLHYGFIALTGTPDDSGEAELNLHTYTTPTRVDRESELSIRVKGEDGALPWWTFDFPHDIEWNLDVKISARNNPLSPIIQVLGEHDRYPAYEVIVLKSDGQFSDVYRHSPAAGDLPGPTSLDDNNALDVSETEFVDE